MFRSKAEKEKKVIELYLKGKTIREIAKEVHMSFSTICSIIKKYEDGLIQKDNLQNSNISEETKAIQLFSEGKTPTEVKIKLDMATEVVERLFKDYWKLQEYHQLYTIFETEIKKDLSSFLRLYKRIRELGISNDVILQALRNINELPLINMSIGIRRKELKDLGNLKDSLESDITDRKKSIASAKRLLDNLQDEIMRRSSIVGSDQE